MTEQGIVARSKHLRRLLGRPALASPATDDAFPIVDASEKEVKQITYAELSAAIGSTVDIAAMIHAATSKTTPIDADELGIWDSVSAALRKLTWANIKATLKTYFDGLYAVVAHTHAQLHDRSHAITSTSDHTSSATAGKLLKADANGLPAEATNTDAEVAAAVAIAALFATGYDDLPIEWGLDLASAPDAAELYENNKAKAMIRKFDSAGAQGVAILWPIPQDIKVAGADLKYRIRCVVSEATGPSNEAVRFSLAAGAVRDGDSTGGALGSAVTSAATGKTASQHALLYTAWSDVVTPSGTIEKGGFLLADLTRDNTVGSNYGQKIGGVSVEFQYVKG